MADQISGNFPCVAAGQLGVHISSNPQQWILILTSTKSKPELCSF